MRLAPYASLLLLAAIAAGCATGRPPPDPPVAPATRPAPRPEPQRPGQVGVASWYSDKLHGRLTANGERYDRQAATCAHRTLPFGTRLHVEVLDSGRTAQCRVNDRGPFVEGRIVDVSRAIAQQLGLIDRGLARVRITTVE